MSKYSRRRGLEAYATPIIAAIVVIILLALAFLLIFRKPKQQEQEIPTNQPEVSAPADETINLQRSHYQRKKNFYTILVSGVDAGNGGSDTNILLAVDAEGNRIYGVSIPRDAKAMFDGEDHKINYAYGYNGMKGMANTVSDQLGIPVDYTVKVDLRGFVRLVDAIGGVNFDVPVDMDYDDPFQNLSIHLTAGMQHLNGTDALNVVRFRHNNDGTGYINEDLGRMATQQEFLLAVAKQTLVPANLDKVNELVKIFRDYVETDLTLGNLAWLGKEVISIGADNIAFSSLTGTWVSPYIYLDKDAVLDVVNEHLNPYVEDRTAEDLNIPS